MSLGSFGPIPVRCGLLHSRIQHMSLLSPRQCLQQLVERRFEVLERIDLHGNARLTIYCLLVWTCTQPNWQLGVLVNSYVLLSCFIVLFSFAFRHREDCFVDVFALYYGMLPLLPIERLALLHSVHGVSYLSCLHPLRRLCNMYVLCIVECDHQWSMCRLCNPCNIQCMYVLCLVECDHQELWVRHLYVCAIIDTTLVSMVLCIVECDHQVIELWIHRPVCLQELMVEAS